MIKKYSILVVEDEVIIAKDICDQLEYLGYTVCAKARSYEKAIQQIENVQVDLVLMDIQIDGDKDGIETATDIVAKYDIPIVFLTGHSDDFTFERAKNLGPYGYILKPFNESTLHMAIQLALAKHQMNKELKEAHKQLQASFYGTIHLVADMVKAKYPAISKHQQRVSDLAVSIAKEMVLSKDQMEGIRIASLVHAVGLIGIPNEVLFSQEILATKASEQYKLYPKIGHDLLKKIDFPWPIAEMVLQHRELLDGSGFPKNLTADKQMLESKIIAVAYFVVSQIYQKQNQQIPFAHRTESALAKLRALSNIHYDSEIVAICLKVFHENFSEFST